MNKVETYNRKNILSQIKWLIKMVRYLLKKESSEGGGIQSIQEGNNISIDNTDPQNPIVSSTGGTTPTLAQVLAEGNVADTGIEGSSYFGANYDDNTYVQKKYVDDAIDAIPTPSLTLEQARKNGNVLEGDVEFDYGCHKISQEFGDGSGGISMLEFCSTGKISLSATNNYYTLLNINEDNIIAEGLKKGIIGNIEFDKQGDRKAFAQIADLEDYLETLPGFDPSSVQVLRNINGVIQWNTEKV